MSDAFADESREFFAIAKRQVLSVGVDPARGWLVLCAGLVPSTPVETL
jgi:hypothetical protein